MNNKGLLDAIKTSSHITYTSKVGYEILQKQWMSVLATQHLTFCDDMVPVPHILNLVGVESESRP